VIELDLATLWNRVDLFAMEALSIVEPEESADMVEEAAMRFRTSCRDAVRTAGSMPTFKLSPQAKRLLRPLNTFGPSAVYNERNLFGQTYIAYVILHEAGHLRKGHVGKPADAAQSKNNEMEADTFAFEQMHALGYPMRFLEVNLRGEAMLQELCRQAGYEFAEEHPSWRERLQALIAFNETHPPIGDSIELCGWWHDPAHGGALRQAKLQMYGPADARSPTRGSIRLENWPQDVEGTSLIENGLTTFRFRSGNEQHRLALLTAYDHEVEVHWSIRQNDEIAYEEHLTLYASRFVPDDLFLSLFRMFGAGGAFGISGADVTSSQQIRIPPTAEKELNTIFRDYVAGRIEEKQLLDRARKIRRELRQGPVPRGDQSEARTRGIDQQKLP
jgi:hypothetical protein